MWWRFADGSGVGGGGHRVGWLRWSCEALTRTPEDPATEDRLPLAELLAEAGDEDFLRTVAEAVVQLLMEADVGGLIPCSVSNALALRERGAGRHERSGERVTCRNGFRDRAPDTRPDALQLRIPKLRPGLLPAVPGAADTL